MATKPYDDLNDRLTLAETVSRIEKMNAETHKLVSETRFVPINTILALIGAAGGLIAATLALAKILMH